MIRIFCLILFSLFFNVNSFCQKEKDSIEASISKFFDGLSERDTNKLKAYTTDDFILLENGHLWNMDTLVHKMSAPKNAGIKRINKFQFIKTEQNGNIAWTSYHNTADFSLNEKQQTVNWLESAVLKKENGRWKIKLLHSTRVEPFKQN
jgi:ketosteroid isomerase-like protein